MVWELCRFGEVGSAEKSANDTMGYALFSLKKNCHAKWGPDLRREVLYMASCGVFCLAGLWAIVHAERVLNWLRAPTGEWGHFSGEVFRAHGIACMLQGVLSFLSDVVYIDARSIFHPLDRVMAIILTAGAVWIEGCIILYGPLGVALRLLMVALITFALGCHLRAKHGVVVRNYERYVHNHTIWHVAVVSSMVVPLHIAISLPSQP